VNYVHLVVLVIELVKNVGHVQVIPIVIHLVLLNVKYVWVKYQLQNLVAIHVPQVCIRNLVIVNGVLVIIWLRHLLLIHVNVDLDKYFVMNVELECVYHQKIWRDHVNLGNSDIDLGQEWIVCVVILDITQIKLIK
jgi:hypothetical protein